MYVCMYVCMYACMFACMYVCMHVTCMSALNTRQSNKHTYLATCWSDDEGSGTNMGIVRVCLCHSRITTYVIHNRNHRAGKCMHFQCHTGQHRWVDARRRILAQYPDQSHPSRTLRPQSAALHTCTQACINAWQRATRILDRKKVRPNNEIIPNTTRAGLTAKRVGCLEGYVDGEVPDDVALKACADLRRPFLESLFKLEID